MNFVGKLVLRNKVYNDFIIIGYKTSTKLSLCMSPAVPFLSYPILSTFFSFTCMHTLVHIVCLVMSFGMEICLVFFE